jgi:para-nitrobenzyl esterase
LMRAEPWQLVKALDQLNVATVRDMPGSFTLGPTVDGDYLPADPIVAIARGQAHPVPLIIGNNAEEGRLFARFLKMLPASEPVIERLLAHLDPATRERITAAYPGYPHPDACLRLGADFAFGSAAWQVAEAHRKHAPTYLYRYDYAPRTLSWSGFGATHATELLAVFDAYRTRFGSLLTLAGDRRSALRVSNDVQSRWRAFSRTGVPGRDWPAYTEPERAVMVFDRTSRVEYDPTPDRRQAWQDFSLAR